MKPTDEMLNRSAAEACGWRIGPLTAKSPSGSNYAVRHDDGRNLEPWPDYCEDKNSHTELYKAVENACQTNEFGWKVLMLNLIRARRERHAKPSDLWYVVTSPPRLVVIAALKALGKWPEEWETSE